MRFQNAEDRLNPLVPEGTSDTTLGGYLQVHGRAVAFDGPDGLPYTVAIDTEHTPGEEEPWAAYLVFIRWAATGSAIMGHVETEDLAFGESEDEARAALEELPLNRVKALLDDAVRRRDSVDE